MGTALNLKKENKKTQRVRFKRASSENFLNLCVNFLLKQSFIFKVMKFVFINIVIIKFLVKYWTQPQSQHENLQKVRKKFTIHPAPQ